MKLFRVYIYSGEKNNGTSKLGELVDYKFSEIKTSRPIEFIKKYRHAHVTHMYVRSILMEVKRVQLFVYTLTFLFATTDGPTLMHARMYTTTHPEIRD